MGARELLIGLLATSCVLAEVKTSQPQEVGAKQKVEQTKTQTFDFPPGGLLRLKHSEGDLTIEAWDKPNVEITTVKSTKDEFPESERAKASAELDRVTVGVERRGDELVISTDYPRHRGFPLFLPFRDAVNFNLEYHISVPRNARLAIEHNVGAVNVDGVTGDIEAKLLQGEIMLHLPEDLQYNINAKSEFGNVNSDFPGEKHRAWLSQSAIHAAPRPAPILNLRVGYGDIVLLRIRIPKTPDAAPAPPARSGL